jgi:hypothetical protein
VANDNDPGGRVVFADRPQQSLGIRLKLDVFGRVALLPITGRVRVERRRLKQRADGTGCRERSGIGRGIM